MSQITKAGKIIKKADVFDAKLFPKERAIVKNWRESHGYPLHAIYVNLRGLVKGRKDCIVAERLKRFESIVGKLSAGRCNNLWNMQDLGGCRLIVPNIEDVRHYAKRYENSKQGHIWVRSDDYITNPTPLGYRSLHVVYQYHSDKNPDYNRNMLIEIQFRTHLQHVWATAVETMGIFTKKAIKSGQGSKEENRFFALISTLFALQEGQPIVPNTTDNIHEIVDEIRQLDFRNNFLNRLQGFKVATRISHKAIKTKTGYCILQLDYANFELRITRYKPNEFEKANAYYNVLENRKKAENFDVVLVQVNSFNSLQQAYPNYFSDINEFTGLVHDYLCKY